MRRVRGNWNRYIGGHLPSVCALDPDQHHHERLRHGILTAISDSDADGRIRLSDFRSDEDDFLFFVNRVDTKWLLVHIVQMLHDVVDAPISMPPDGLSNKES